MFENLPISAYFLFPYLKFGCYCYHYNTFTSDCANNTGTTPSALNILSELFYFTVLIWFAKLSWRIYMCVRFYVAYDWLTKCLWRLSSFQSFFRSQTDNHWKLRTSRRMLHSNTLLLSLSHPRCVESGRDLAAIT